MMHSDVESIRKHTKLVDCYGGLFCPTHAKELGDIRSCIEYYKLGDGGKTAEDIKYETYYREKEQLFRKQMHAGHMRCISILACSNARPEGA